MTKTFLILRSGDPVEFDREELIKYLESENTIEDWAYCLPYSIFVKSKYDAQYLSELIEKKYGAIVHLILKIDGANYSSYFGRLPEEYWDIIMN